MVPIPRPRSARGALFRRWTAAALRFVSTLRIVNLAFCKFPRIDLAHQLHFPQLKLLYLYGVSISTFDIHSLVGGCTALEGLQIEGTSGFTALCIYSCTLRTIGVSCRSIRGDRTVFSLLLILSASSLERLILLDPAMPTKIMVSHAPKMSVRLRLFQMLLPSY